MKHKRTTKTIAAIAIGITILLTAAFADMMLGSGYYGLKDSAKTTMAKLSKEVDNFSMNMIYSFKVDDETYTEENEEIKFDIANQAKESQSQNIDRGKIRKNYSYNDKNKTIFKDFETGIYNVYDRTNIRSSAMNNGIEYSILSNPFEEERVEDFEKIVDAFVGSLQDIIQVEESNNKKMYIGNLSGTQVPPLVNATLSFALKYTFYDDIRSARLGIPYPKENIYVIDVSGKAIENEEGILENIIASIRMVGVDKEGIEHTYLMEVAFEIKDINNTIVQEPNLEGEEVKYTKDNYSEFDERYIGTYKNDIVVEEEDSFVKKGERILEISSVQDGKISGRYYETYYDGYAPKNPNNFEFTTEKDNKRQYFEIFNYTDDKGKKKTGTIHRSKASSLRLELDVTISEDGYSTYYNNYDENYDAEFIRIFE